MRDLLVGLLVLLLVVLGLSGAAYLSWYGYDYFAPKYEDSRRKTFEQSRAFNEGMLRDLQNLRWQYLRGSPEVKATLRATIIHRFSVYDIERLPPELRVFYRQLEQEQRQ